MKKAQPHIPPTPPRTLVILEESVGRTVANPAGVAALFGQRAWLHLCSTKGVLWPVSASCGIEHFLPDDSGQAVGDFYSNLFAADGPPEIVFRLQNPVYPLPAWFGDEIEHLLPSCQYDYVVSSGEPFGMHKFFMERLSSAVFGPLLNEGEFILPTGCFNGLILPRSQRHYFSPRMQRYCLVDQFEELFDSPRTLAVDAISRCNYTCAKCPFHSPALPPRLQKAPMPPMPVATFGKILKKAQSYKKLTTIVPTLTGEPLAHPDIVELVRRTKDAGFDCCFTTNASLLSEKMTDRLLEAGTGPLAFSVDAVEPATYRRLQGGALDIIEKNILYFQQRFQKKYGNFIGTMSFVLSSENEKERQAYKEKWLQRGFHVTFYAQHDWTLKMKPYAIDNRWNLERTPCLSPWHSLFLSETLQPVCCSLEAARKRPAAGLPSFLEADPAFFWREHPGRKPYRDGSICHLAFCGECSCWADMQGSMYKKQNDEIISQAVGSKTYVPPRALA